MTDLALDTLEARGLIRVATLQPELEYLFRHALLQDTAYESLLKQERRALHQLVGQTIEDLYPERAGELAAVLAMHFEQAGDTAKATDYLMAAAAFAMARNAIVEGFDLYTRAAALLPARADDEDDATVRRRVLIELGRARAGFSFVPEAEALAIIEPVLPDAKRLGDVRLEADVILTIALLRQFRGERPDHGGELAALLERVTEIGRELNDPLIAALPESIIGLFQIFRGELRAGTDTLEKVAPLLEAKHDFVGSSFALVALALGLARMGEFERAERAAQRATEIAESGDLIARLDALIGESTVRSLRGDLDGAVPIAMKCTNLAEETGATACVVASNFVLGDAYMRQGRFGEAKIAFERGNQVATAISERVFRPSISAYMRSNAASLGEPELNAASFEESLAESRRFGDMWAEANIIWKRAETAAKERGGATRDEQMLADFAEAARQFAAMEARPFRARVMRDWGRALRDLQRTDEGNEKLRAALELFDEMGISREAAELREVLSAG